MKLALIFGALLVVGIKAHLGPRNPRFLPLDLNILQTEQTPSPTPFTLNEADKEKVKIIPWTLFQMLNQHGAENSELRSHLISYLMDEKYNPMVVDELLRKTGVSPGINKPWIVWKYNMDYIPEENRYSWTPFNQEMTENIRKYRSEMRNHLARGLRSDPNF